MFVNITVYLVRREVRGYHRTSPCPIYMNDVRWGGVRHMETQEHEESHAWWRHQVETFSALLALCTGNSPVTGEFPAQRPVMRSFDVFFDLRLNTQLSKQPRSWGFDTPTRLLWHHCNATFLFLSNDWQPRFRYGYWCLSPILYYISHQNICVMIFRFPSTQSNVYFTLNGYTIGF